MKKLHRFVRAEDGPTAVEYAVMLALVIAICLVSIGALGGTTTGSYDNSFSAIESAMQ